VTPANLISRFQITGIFPFNPYIIPEEPFVLSTSTQENHINDKTVIPARQLSEETFPDSSTARLSSIFQ
jgi:hypothetical protein